MQKAVSATELKPRRLGVRLVVIFLLGTFLGWQIIVNTMADTRSRPDPDGALAWRTNLPAALVALAEQRLLAAKTSEDLTAAGDLAERALKVSPLADGALRLVGLAADLQGDAAKARVLMDLAGSRSRHDTVAQVWLYDQNVQTGRLTEALGNADALLRTRPDLSDRMLPALAHIAADATARPTLINLLGSDPPWRAWLLNALPKAADPSVAFAVLSGLGATGEPPRDSEIQPYLNQLIDSGQIEFAYLAWLNFLPAERGKPVSYVYNGDFEIPPSGLSFDWVIGNVSGAQTETADTGEAERGRALRVTFANTRVPYNHLGKLMILPPGSYQLTGLARADHLVNERGMVWRVYCGEGDKQLLAESARIKGTTPWHRFATGFVVPATGCRGQWLRLELAARVALEQDVGGEIWFDDLAITRQRAVAEPGVAEPGVTEPVVAQPVVAEPVSGSN